jgi:murein DD-endopeptidase MepM/ murein hydrolase activator NlpD
MVPVKRDERAFAAAALIAGALLLAGCETAPPNPADYWPDAQAEAQAKPTYLTVVVHDGDTLADIAGRYSVSSETIERMNDLSDGDTIYAGESLKLPAGSKVTRKAVMAEAEQPHYASWNAPGLKASVTVKELGAPAIVHRTPEAEAAQPKPKMSALDAALADEASDEIAKALAAKPGKKDKVTSGKGVTVAPAKEPPPEASKSDNKASDKSTDASAAGKASDAASSAAEFEWPVQGKIIGRFGKDGDGERNDGINIAADLGTPIHAAAAGIVTYAGNELKSYGNLVLIKHDNGYVTAYAHAQRITVSRGDHVDRGDVIGYTGQTGDVTSPQVHFEVRQGVKPVDPRPLLMAAKDS